MIEMNERTGLSKAQRDFRRSLEQARKSRYTLEQKKRILKTVKRDFLRNRNLLFSLPDLSLVAAQNIVHYNRNGVDIVVKDVSNGLLAGEDYKNYLEFHRLHGLAIKEGLISPSHTA